MTEIYRVYKSAGLTIVEIHYNNEFRNAMDNFAAEQDPPININDANATEYVPITE